MCMVWSNVCFVVFVSKMEVFEELKVFVESFPVSRKSLNRLSKDQYSDKGNLMFHVLFVVCKLGNLLHRLKANCHI